MFNPNYEIIANSFVSQYYKIFDDPDLRNNIVDMYDREQSSLTFEGQKFQGSAKILEKFKSIFSQKMIRSLIVVDSQPMFDGGILINILGRLQLNDARLEILW